MRVHPMIAAAAVLPLLLVGAGPAAAGPAAGPPALPANRVLPLVVFDGETATVAGTYQCAKGVQAVLWASVKQGGSGDLSAEGSSRTAASWYDVHQPLRCDGKVHPLAAELTQQTAVGREPYVDLRPTRRAGKAWVQWCVTDPAAGEHGLLASDQTYAPVLVRPGSR